MFFWICVGVAIIGVIYSLIKMALNGMNWNAVGYAFWSAFWFIFLLGILLGAFVWH